MFWVLKRKTSERHLDPDQKHLAGYGTKYFFILVIKNKVSRHQNNEFVFSIHVKRVKNVFECEDQQNICLL